jgi:DNA-directed RNA polymerase subunit RPC12/RpoP
MKLEDKKKIFEEAKENNAVIPGKRVELTDEELDDVAGGYTEDLNVNGLWSKGWWIQCPYCGNADKSIRDNADLLLDNDKHTVEYKCTCGERFIVDGDTGAIYKKRDWVSACRKMGYTYPC